MDTPLIDDDHIISLLRKDAQASRFGSSFTAEKRDKNAPKPNTRFLRNLVRDADSHNAALLAKEKAETKARLRGLESGAKRDKENGRAGRDDGARKRRREGEREGRWKGVLTGLGGPSTRVRDSEGRHERHHKSSKEERVRPRSEKAERDEAAHTENRRHRTRRSRSLDSRSGSRSRSPSHHRRTHRERRPHHRSRSREHGTERRRPPKRHPSPADHHAADYKPTSKAQRRRRSPGAPSARAKQDESASDSDPLASSLLGPAPPPTTLPRGRGANNPSRTSNIDLRFNDPSYNPRLDVSVSDSEPESEARGRRATGNNNNNGGDDDWSTSLEALRDRAAWREKGAQRLREAGFGEEDVRRFEGGSSGREKDERDLRWRKKGDGREWDAGKVVEGDGDGDGDGEVRVKAAWTRGIGGL